MFLFLVWFHKCLFDMVYCFFVYVELSTMLDVLVPGVVSKCVFDMVYVFLMVSPGVLSVIICVAVDLP